MGHAAPPKLSAESFGARPSSDAFVERRRRSFGNPSNRAHVANGFPRGDGLHRLSDALRVDAEVAVEIGNRSGLSEMFHAERASAVAMARAEPGERRRVAVDHRDDS